MDLHRLHPGSRLLMAMLLVVGAVAAQGPAVPLLIYGLCCVGAFTSGVDLLRFLRVNFTLILIFVLPVAVLGGLRPFTPGEPLVSLGPVVWTESGLVAGTQLVLRALAAVSVSVLLLRMGGWHDLLRGMEALHVPRSMLLLVRLMMVHIHGVLRTAGDMQLAAAVRRLRPAGWRDVYRETGVRTVVLLEKSLVQGRQVHAAMMARGIGDAWSERAVAPQRLRWPDSIAIAIAGGLAAAAVVA